MPTIAFLGTFVAASIGIFTGSCASGFTAAFTGPDRGNHQDAPGRLGGTA